MSLGRFARAGADVAVARARITSAEATRTVWFDEIRGRWGGPRQRMAARPQRSTVLRPARGWIRDGVSRARSSAGVAHPAPFRRLGIPAASLVAHPRDPGARTGTRSSPCQHQPQGDVPRKQPHSPRKPRKCKAPNAFIPTNDRAARAGDSAHHRPSPRAVPRMSSASTPKRGIYAISKWGIIALTKAMVQSSGRRSAPESGSGSNTVDPPAGASPASDGTRWFEQAPFRHSASAPPPVPLGRNAPRWSTPSRCTSSSSRTRLPASASFSRATTRRKITGEATLLQHQRRARPRRARRDPSPAAILK